MRQILYVSSAAKDFEPERDLEAILEASHRNNPEAGVTGMLLYAEGSFFQVLEGPEEAVAAVYARVQRDSRHSGVITMLSRTIENRDFPSWSMGFRSAGNVRELPAAFFELTQPHLDHHIAPKLSGQVVTLLKVFARTSLDDGQLRAQG